MTANPPPHPHIRTDAYRPDIDGLRAVAVLGVVVFHLGLIGGGFAGVDIFFVISGFLITRILIGELSTGTFGAHSLARFFERRIRRILPALAAMCIAAFVASYLLLFPNDFKEFGRSLQSVAIFASNIHFQRKTGYFEGAAGDKPLLHTWSLGIEEQYYLLFPLALWLVWRWRGPLAASTLCFLVAAASLAYSNFAVETFPAAAFFSTPARIWELLTGSLLAMSQGHFPASRPLRETLAMAGALLIAWTFAMYSAATEFPGLGALAPVGGAALIIAAGGKGPTLVSRLLQTPPLVGIGLISYSVYLWHWPLFVFANYRFAPFPEQGAAAIYALLFATSLALGYVSWRFIEQPFRQRRLAPRQAHVFAAQAALTLAMVAAGALVSKLEGMPKRWPDDVVSILEPEVQSTTEPRRCATPVSAEFKNIRLCDGAGNAASSGMVLLWGDSHAVMLARSLAALATEDRPMLSAANPGCPPVLDAVLGGQGRSDRCRERNDKVLRYLEQHPHSVSTVVMAARWAFYAEGTRMPFEGGRGVVLGGGTPAEAPAVLKQQLQATVATLLKYVDNVVIIAPFPEFDRAVAASLARARAWNLPALEKQPMSVVSCRQKTAVEAIESAAGADPSRVRIASPLPYFCDATSCDYADANGMPFFGDNNHLNALGLVHIKKLLEETMAPPKG
jgi:peptidoglycan/LPS O-acetylase OafA/YrhL